MTGYKGYTHLLFEQSGRVMTVSINRPEMNPVNEALHTDLARVFGELNADSSIDIVVLTAKGRTFCAGGDIDYLEEMCADPMKFEQSRAEAKQIVFGILECEKIIIGKINGHAIGLGATLALLCDIIFAADHVSIADPHVKVGLVAGDGGSLIWPLVLGPAKAKQYLLTGDPISAPEAASLGLINWSVPAAELDAAVDAYVARLGTGAMLAIKFTKVAATLPIRQLAHQLFDASIAYEALSQRSADHAEGVAAFAARRAPNFTGR